MTEDRKASRASRSKPPPVPPGQSLDPPLRHRGILVRLHLTSKYEIDINFLYAWIHLSAFLLLPTNLRL